ncbi:MAG: STAS domain-containing protein [Nitrospirae bacterium]|nr:STAS domain-containing protein [Nitrospirota bacterium]
MKDQLTFSIRTIGSISILDLDGKIIGSWALLMKNEIKRLSGSGISSVILNFAEVSSIDSLGVMTITSSIEEGIPIKLINVNSSCLDILEQNHSIKIIPIVETEDETIDHTVAKIPLFSEKRMHERFPANIPVEILINNNKERGVLLNISEEGALVGYLDPLSIEARGIKLINIMMKLPFLGTLELEGIPLRFGRNSHMNTIGIRLYSKEKSRSFINQIDQLVPKGMINHKATYSRETPATNQDI